MGKIMKGGIPYGGVADVDLTNENVILTMGEMPSNPHADMTVLYQGATTSDFISNHIYQYSGTEWVDITYIESISSSVIDSLFN